jgi:hypothetical protein
VHFAIFHAIEHINAAVFELTAVNEFEIDLAFHFVEKRNA